MLRDILGDIKKAKYFTIMADETADISNQEQLVICLRWVDEALQPQESFVGLYPLERTSANDIVLALKVYLSSIFFLPSFPSTS